MYILHLESNYNLLNSNYSTLCKGIQILINSAILLVWSQDAGWKHMLSAWRQFVIAEFCESKVSRVVHLMLDQCINIILFVILTNGFRCHIPR